MPRLAPIWTGEDWAPWFRNDVLNGAVPIAVLFAVLVTASWQHAPKHAEPPHLDTDLEPVHEVLRSENQIIFEAASGVLDERPAIQIPRARGWKNAADMAMTLLLVLMQVVDAEYSGFHRQHIRWFFVWAAGCALARIALHHRKRFWGQKLALGAAYFVVTLFNLRTALLNDATPRMLALLGGELACSGGLVLLAMLVRTTAPLPPALTRLHETYPPRATPAASTNAPPPQDLYTSPLARVTMGYLTNFIYAQYWVPTTLGAIPQVLPYVRTACVVGLARLADQAHGAHPASLHRRLWRAIGSLTIQQLLLQVLRVSFRMGPILSLSALLSYAEDRDAATREGRLPPPLHLGLLFALTMLVSQIGESLSDVNCMQTGRAAASKMRALVITEVFSKILRRKMHYESTASETQAVPEVNDGHVMNLIAVDTMKIEALVSQCHQPLVEHPLTILYCVIFLFHTLGVASLIGILIMLVASPLQARLSKRMLKIQELSLRATDARLNLANEVLASIKTVKFFAWERPFAQRMNNARTRELRMLYLDNVVSVLSNLIFVGMPMLVTLATFGIYTLVLGQPLTAQKAFTSLSIFVTLRTPLADFPELLVVMLNSWVSIRRVDTFLGTPETEKYDQLLKVAPPPTYLGFDHASFTFARTSDSAPRFSLKDLDCKFPVGETSIVVGPVGSGKTSLLLAMLGELHRTKGSTSMPCPITRSTTLELAESVAYCGQSPWILGTTVRQNILFGAAFDERRYRQVLAACALEPDLDILEYHDETEVGEKGTSLSGGQKARVALARAFYSNAKHILIDDALSAVDAHTAHHIVDHCFSGPLAKGRTIVLVTHAVSLMHQHAKYAAVMDGGRVRAQGAPADLLAAGDLPSVETLETQMASSLYEEQESDDARWAATQAKRDRKDVEANAESIQRKTKGGDLYLTYIGAISEHRWVAAGLWLSLLALYVSVRSADVSSNSWLRFWASSYDDPSAHHENTLYYMKRYVLLVLLFVFLSAGRDMAQFSIAMRASKRMYTDLIASLMRAPPRFFDVTPIGRIMNRLSKDIQTVDTEITPALRMLTEGIVTLLAILGVICWAAPQFLYFVGFVLAVYYVIGALYLASSRDLKRIESVQRSPLYTLLGETLAGTVTIRAYSDTQRVVYNCMNLLDSSTRAYICLWTENRWVSVRVNVMGALVTFSTAVLLLVSHADAALLGFTLSYAVLILVTILRIVRRYTMTEITLNSVERVQEYIDLPPENQGGAEPPAHWPTDTGSIDVRNLSVRYAPEFPLALRDVSFRIAPGEKVGIVGRTGSGKSTLSLAFFRFLEAEAGSIVIDGIDISTVTLEALRSRLTIIPQDSQLFKGTVRTNLDPFGTCDDTDMWFALQRCQLASGSEQGTFTPSKTSVVQTLDDPVEQGGANLSAGQRQLLSLARGLLKMRDSRILILDESTANLDSESDALIQHTIREQMAPGATILTVAHRLRTIIDYDKVLVLDKGQVLEFDSPSRLLANTSSEFYGLCKRSGELNALTEAAHAAQKRPFS